MNRLRDGYLNEDIFSHNASNRDMSGDNGIHEGGGTKFDGEEKAICQHRWEQEGDERLSMREPCENYPITANIPHVGDGRNDLDGEEEQEKPSEDARVVGP